MGWLLYTTLSPAAVTMFLRLISLILPPGLAQKTSFAAFTVTSFTLLILCAAYGVVAGLVLRPLGYGGLVQWTVGRAFKWGMWLCTGVTFRVTGSMKKSESSGKEAGGSDRWTGEDVLNDWDGVRPVVFVGNHQTEMDVLMLGCMFPKWCSVTAKKSLKWTPFLGQFMSLSMTIFLDRANRASSRAAFDSAASTMLTTRQSVFIFPEGTRSYATEPFLLPFKKGAFHLAIQAQVPVVPVVCANYDNVLNVKEKRIRPGVVDVSILPPISTKGCTKEDVDALVERTRNAMLDELVRLSHVTDGGKNGMPLSSASAFDGAARELRKRN